jgi:large subunit ribosomal protein L19
MKARGYTKETVHDLGVGKLNFPAFSVGDTIAISQRIKEGDKERLQVFEGDVIAIKNRGISSTFTIRKIGAHGVAVERIMPFYSPLIKSIKIVKKGDVRRAKLYYMRERLGKSARVKEKVMTKEQWEQMLEQEVTSESATEQQQTPEE